MAKKSKELNGIPTVLAYSKSIDTTPGIMNARLKDNSIVPIEIQDMTLRGCISDYKSSINLSGKNIDAPNIQKLDYAIMPQDSVALQISFGIKVSGNSKNPTLCNVMEYQNVLAEITHLYAEKGGYRFLAAKYLKQIFFAKWGWRNLDDVARVIVKVVGNDNETYTTLSNEITENFEVHLNEGNLKNLLDKFTNALEGKSVLRLEVQGEFYKSGFEEVFPSQEFDESDKTKKQGQKSKFLYAIPTKECQKHAALHSQKIGNALRTIDEWWTKDNTKAPFSLAVEPLGYISSQQRAIRNEYKNDLYSQLKNIEDFQSKVAEVNVFNESHGDIHHVIACLIRGGVFGMKDKD